MTRFRLFYLTATAGFLAACGSAPMNESKISHPGQAIFNGYGDTVAECYSCHGGDGRGSGLSPDLSRRVPRMSDEQLLVAIDEGPGMMPSYAGKLSDEERELLVEWLRAEFGPSPKVEQK